MKVGIFGAGYSGQVIGNALFQTGATVWGTSRDRVNIAALEARGIDPLLFDGAEIGPQLSTSLESTTHLVISIAPFGANIPTDTANFADPVLSAIGGKHLQNLAPKLQWIGYLSTVGVYGHHFGNWVDESTPAAPVSERSKQRVRAENEWVEVGESINIRIGIFRLSGIYGPGRNALLNAHRGKSRRLIKKDQVFNRIHVEDIAAALKLAAQQNASGIFNVTDDEPTPPQNVVSFAHTLVGTEPPAEIEFETADISEMVRSFYGENKRVSNKLSKQALGLKYAFPNYREALKRMWENDGWRE